MVNSETDLRIFIDTHRSANAIMQKEHYQEYEEHRRGKGSSLTEPITFEINSAQKSALE